MVEQTLLDYLGKFLTDERKQRIQDVLSERTEHVTVVLEDIFHAHNASAVMRTCDCFGVQNFHVIEEENKYKVSKYVVRGAENWVSLFRYGDAKVNNRSECINNLKSEGYDIVVTSPHASKSFRELPINRKMAFCFGAEKTGISKELYEMADHEVQIPMYGFTESLNISVSAALIVSEYISQLKQSCETWQLSKDRRQQLLEEWYIKSLKFGEVYVSEYEKLQKSITNAS